MRALLAAVVVGLALTGCSHPAPPSSTDQLGSLEAGVDAISRQVESDTSG